MSSSYDVQPPSDSDVGDQPGVQSLATMTDIQQARVSTELALLDEARAAIDKATTVADAKEIKSRAEAIETYAKQAEYGEILQQRCVEIRLRAERKAGELLAQEKLSKGGRPFDAKQPESHDSPVNATDGSTTLADLGLTKDQSKKWQKIASIPEADFEDVVVDVLSEAELLRLADRKAKESVPKPPPPPPAPTPPPPDPDEPVEVDPSPYAPEGLRRKCFCQSGPERWVVELGAYEALYEAACEVLFEALIEQQYEQMNEAGADSPVEANPLQSTAHQATDRHVVPESDRRDAA